MHYQKSHRTRELIYNSAKKAMYENGYKKTTIQYIASLASVPSGLINYYYKKYEILECIYYDFFSGAYELIETQLGDRVENAIMRHILMTNIVMYKLFSDKKELEVYLEVAREGIFPPRVHELVKNNYAAQMWNQYDIKMPFEEYYLLNFAEYGARKELLYHNANLDVNDPFFSKLMNIISTITIRLAGIDSNVIDVNLQKANELFKELDYNNVSFLK